MPITYNSYVSSFGFWIRKKFMFFINILYKTCILNTVYRQKCNFISTDADAIPIMYQYDIN